MNAHDNTSHRKYLHGEPNPAADLIRKKIATLYSREPDAVDEAVESVQAGPKRSRHQQFMYELATSGKSLAQIQTEWHAYYIGLNDKEKHEVWQEFYAADPTKATHHTQPPAPEVIAQQSPAMITSTMSPITEPPKPKASSLRSVAEIKRHITSTVRTRGKLSRKQHVQSLAFGLGMGALMMLLLLFGFFNERFIAPFITPNRNVSATPLILDPNNSAVGPESKVIIPKINVEVPVVYDVATVDESAIQTGLERGVVHYATTPNPGEQGNSVIFGHSSNNILNKGKFKFAFVLLSRMEKEDTFYLQKDGVRYVYKVIDKKIVKPTDLSVLEPLAGKVATATLITCDPPGTTINRLVIVGEQVSPDPGGNTASTALKTDEQPEILAGNAESLWHRIVNWIF